MDTTPNTIPYLIAGYSVIFGFLLIYLVSLIVRWRKLRTDERMLSELEENQE